jgi:hypothetical protein
MPDYDTRGQNIPQQGGLPEMIITVIRSVSGDEPGSHHPETLVFRFEFDTADDIDNIVRVAQLAAVDGGQMCNTLNIDDDD